MFFFSTMFYFPFPARSNKAPDRWAGLFAFPKQTGKP